jgi:hypothetical protein
MASTALLIALALAADPGGALATTAPRSDLAREPVLVPSPPPSSADPAPADVRVANAADPLVTAPGTTTATRLGQRFANMGVNVKSDFGASGDGVRDDTAAVTAALASGFRDIYFPPGTYLITGRLSLTNGAGITLRGAGKTSSILLWHIDRDTIDKYALYLDANVSIRDMALVNTGDDVSTSVALCSQAGPANGMHDGEFMRLRIEGFGNAVGSSQGLALGMTYNTLFDSIDIRGCGVPIALGAGSNNVRFVKGSISGTRGNRMIRLVNASTVTFDSVAFEPFDPAVKDAALIAEIVLSPNVAFRNCYYEPSYGLYFDSSPGFAVEGSLVEGFDWAVGNLTRRAHVRATDASNHGAFAVPMRGRVAQLVSRATSNPPTSYAAVDDNNNTVTTVEHVTARDWNLSATPVEQLARSWTPSLVGAAGGSAHAYGERFGYFVRTGPVVTAFFRIAVATVDPSMAGELAVSGLPFRVADLPEYDPPCPIAEHSAALASGYAQLAGKGRPGSTSILLVQSGARVAPLPLSPAELAGPVVLVGQITYVTDAP